MLAGYLSKLPIPPAWGLRVLNIHPSLLPAFGGPGMYGDRVHAAALARGVTVSGCTVHFVTEKYDEGPILLQRTVPGGARRRRGRPRRPGVRRGMRRATCRAAVGGRGNRVRVRLRAT